MKILEVNEKSYLEKYGVSLQQSIDQIGIIDTISYEELVVESKGKNTENLIPDDVRMLVCIGLADGSFVRNLIKGAKSVKYSVIFEPDIKNFLYCCCVEDLSDLILDDKIRIIIGGSDIRKQLETFINGRIDALIVRHMYTFIIPGYRQGGEELRTYLAEQIAELVLRLTASINTEVSQSREMYTNRLCSLLYMPGSNTFGQLERIINGKGIPIVLIGAGPSLKKNADDLRELKDKAILIGCTHAMETLKEHGVDVNMVAAIDMDAGSRFLDYDVEKRLLLAPECAADMQEKYSGNSIYFSFPEEFRCLEELQGEYFEIPKGGSVITAVFNLFVTAGFKKFILVGEDLAYSEDGKSHSGSVQDGSEVGEVYWTESIYGGQIRSRHDWIIFKNSFEKVIEMDDSLLVIDATEGGALIKGTQIMTLKEAVDMCTDSYPVSDWMNALCGRSSIPFESVLRFFKKYEKDCGQMQLYLSDAIELNCKIREKWIKKQYDGKDFNDLCVRYDELYKKITLSDEAEPLKEYCADVLYSYSEKAQYLEEKNDVVQKLENEEELFRGLRVAGSELRSFICELINKTEDQMKNGGEVMTVDDLVEKVNAFWTDEKANLLEVYEAFVLYEENTEQYKKENAAGLCREMLNIISHGDVKALHFLLSAIVELTNNVDVYKELIRLCTEDGQLSKEQRYFAYCQLVYYKFTHPEVNSREVWYLLDDLYQCIYEEYYAELKDLYEKLPGESRNEDFVIVMTSQVLELEHGPTKTLLDRCYILEKKLNKKVYIINTADTLPYDGDMAWYKVHKGNYNTALNDQEYLPYMGCEFSYFQCPNGVPNVSIMREIIKIVKEEMPWYIVSIGGENLTADLCSQIVPVLTVTLGPSERTQCRTTFQMTGHKMDADDVKWIEKRSLPKDHLIEGLFTSAFKEQKHKYTRKELGIPEGEKVCLVVGGRLDSEVSDEFVKLIDRLAQKGIYTAFMGKLNSFDKICSENSEVFKEHVINLGFQSDAMAVYELCDIYLNPKRLGGGTSGAEALYKGLPVLTHDYGDVAIGVGEEFHVSDYDAMYEEAVRLTQDKDYYQKKSKKAIERARALTDGETEFVRIIREMENRESFF